MKVQYINKNWNTINYRYRRIKAILKATLLTKTVTA